MSDTDDLWREQVADELAEQYAADVSKVREAHGEVIVTPAYDEAEALLLSDPAEFGARVAKLVRAQIDEWAYADALTEMRKRRDDDELSMAIDRMEDAE